MTAKLDIFLAAIPGLEEALAEEASELGFSPSLPVRGGVEVEGSWEEVWRANLWLRGASRVLVRLGSFRASNLGELERRARDFAWSRHLTAREPVRLDITCRKSRIAHAGAAAQKLERALRGAASPVAQNAAVTLKIRIDHDRCTISVDTSGEPLHKRGTKVAVGKAPLRETMAALFLRQCGYQPGEPVVDPTCGSGTLLLEAAEIAAGLAPGRHRSFAFAKLASFNPGSWALVHRGAGKEPAPVFFGYDRDDGAIKNARANAERAGIPGHFERRSISELSPPTSEPGLVICNPPYGARIGNPKALHALYRTLGERLRADFSGWRVGIVTSDEALARATGLKFASKGPPIAHGGLKVWLFQAGPL
ncbi:MAG: class I SAM-dependent RNA methyltransferase [Pseudomonadota bacterium]